jgi:hypothetical protein
MPQNHTRKFEVGQTLVAVVHASKSDYDTSSYQSKPMIDCGGKVCTEKITIVKVLTRGRLKVIGEIPMDLQAVRGGFYQCVLGESVAYKF